MYQLTFDLNQFLAEFWHKKPTIIKGGFSNFVDPISPDELAGLSMEEDVDSRFITNKDNKWSAQHGPFPESHFATLDSSHWQLVVQACNHWHLGSAELIEPFKQLPNWLFDDLMVCFSAPSGGVGPHIDQYDVFIIQGSGKRRWRVGSKDIGQYQESIQAGALRQIEGFDAILDQELEAGDILYIPPGFPHEGDTLELSMSYSIGFRSPKEQELLSHFADYVLANDKGDIHLHNPDMQVQSNNGEILASDTEQLTEMLKSALSCKSDVNTFLGNLLSQSRHQLDIVESEAIITQRELAEHLNANGVVRKVSGLRALYHQETMPHSAFINGECFELTSSVLLDALCNHESIDIVRFPELSNATDLEVLTELVNRGYWYFD